jgi:tetratricopeptide (TPR) repeat protein
VAAPKASGDAQDRKLASLQERVGSVTLSLLQARVELLRLQEPSGGGAVLERQGPAAPDGPRTADARRPRDASDAAPAERSFRKGLARFEEGNWPDAAVLLLDAEQAEGFQRSADHPNAVFHLAEALRRQRLWSSAMARYDRLLALPSPPHAKEVLVGAIDCALHLGRSDRAYRLVVAALAASAVEDLPPEALYLLGKSTYHRTDLPPPIRDRRALTFFGAVGPPFRVAATYFRGAIRLRAGDPEGAARELAACAGLPAATWREREQQELCWLALGRIHGEKATSVAIPGAPGPIRLPESTYDWGEALAWYGRVPRSSPRYPEARFESALTLEKADLPDRALRMLPPISEIDPDSTLEPEVRLLRGRLLARLGRHREAEELFEQVRERYGAAGSALDAFMASVREPASYLRLAVPGSDDVRDASLPPLVVRWARGRPSVQRDLEVAASIEAARQLLERTRVESIEARRQLLERTPVEAARAGGVPGASPGAALAGPGRRIDEAGGELAAIRAEAREIIGVQVHRAFREVRAQLDLVERQGDRGMVEIALAREEPGPPGAPGTRSRRQEAMARLEDYARRHPGDSSYTPRALAKLAELRMEEAARGREPAARTPADPEPARAHAQPPGHAGCGGAVDLYERLATGFPDHERSDEFHFMLGYCLGELGRTDESLRAFEDLVRRFPRSPRAPEAWVRIGDAYFQQASPQSTDAAIQAYQKLYSASDHPLHAHAVFMLGWIWYRADDLPRAVDAFTKLLDHEAEVAEREGDRRAPERSKPWAEGVRTIAACFANPGWDGIQQARRWSARVRGRPYEPAVLRALADELFDQARYPAAAETYAHLVALDPAAPDAPRLQSRIVAAWSRDRRPDEEARAREELLSRYVEGGWWWLKNQASADVLTEASALRRDAELSAARHHLAQGHALRKAGRADAALAEYRRAEQGYRSYLEAAPDAKDRAEALFERADAAYHAGEHLMAAELYERVRDDASSTRHREEAARDAVLSWEAHIAEARKSGALEERKVALAKDRRGGPPRAEPLPAPLAELVRASDAFVGGFPGNERAPAIAYRAAEILYAYDHLGESRRRFEELASRWPDSEAARFASNLIIETHLAEKDWAGVERAAARLQAVSVGRDPGLSASLRRVAQGGRFHRAQALVQQGQVDAAAELFLAVAAEDPDGEFADEALYNAAGCYESLRQLDRALPLFERVQAAHPGSSLAEEAAVRIAWNAESVFDFERAAAANQWLVDRRPPCRHRKDALYNAARALEYLQRYEAAAAAFAQYASSHPEAEDAAQALFRAGVVYGKAKAWAKQVQALEDLTTRFSAKAPPELLVEARLRMASAHRELSRGGAATREYAAAVAAFRRLGLRPEASPAAAAAAAESQFRLAEQELQKFERISLPATADPRKLKQPLKAMLADMRRVAPMYEAVKPYRRPDWTIAAFYRQAYLLERFARALHDAPVPAELQKPGREEYLAAYQDQLAQFAQPYEAQAIQVYAQALAAARDLHVENEWTAKILRSLARHRPREYPVRREPRRRLALGNVLPSPGLDDAEREARRILLADQGNVPAMISLAGALHARGRLEAAGAVLESARRAAPEDPWVWHRLGYVQLDLGQRAQALESWRRATELRPEYGEAQADLGGLLLEIHDLAGASRALELAVQHAPACAPAWLALGNAHRAMGRTADARGAYERALKIDPALADAHFNMGILDLEAEGEAGRPAGRLERALVHFDRFEALGGHDPALAQHRAHAQTLLEAERKRAGREEKTRRASEAAPGTVPADAPPGEGP